MPSPLFGREVADVRGVVQVGGRTPASSGGGGNSGIEVFVTDPGAEAAASHDVAELDRRVVDCRACPRLVAWRELAARDRRAAYADEDYWGRPVPGFGPADAGVAVVGLAPAAHGSNRTGRMFTGDRSGDVLFAALHEVGLASQAVARSVDDGMVLFGTRMLSPVRCAPPENKPTPSERDNCRPWLVRELQLLAPTLRAVVVLGAFGWQALLPVLDAAGWPVPRPRPAFGHGAHVVLPPRPGLADRSTLHLLGCYHVSPHNTNTGRLTPAMLDEVLRTAKRIADS
jgi:uracil-DNA glycosylase family 4